MQPKPFASLPSWRFWIDRGGTFTDVIGVASDGAVRTRKVLSVVSHAAEDAVLRGIRSVLEVPAPAPLPLTRITEIRMGTTVATNALLEDRGARTGLLITAGFEDALAIGDQRRPNLFSLAIRKPRLPYAAVAGVPERMNKHGAVLRPLDEGAVREALASFKAQKISSIAIVFMHGHAYPAHEQRVAALAREAGFESVLTSHQSAPEIRLVRRGMTTTVDAALTPVLHAYTRTLAKALPGVPLWFMQSAGGLTDAAGLWGRNSILSGPAGGVVGMTRTAAEHGFARVVGFDMGGTSTDVAYATGDLPRRGETTIAGLTLHLPVLDIHTVAAGGGSVVRYDQDRLQVGPESAGAHPGPASYRNGGPLTVTDCNVLLGRLVPARFPAVFGPDADTPLDTLAVQTGFAALAQHVTAATGQQIAPERLAMDALTIAVATMAQAIRTISVERGHDLTDAVLNVFGGAGAQHACMVAEALGMASAMVHPQASVLSALGMGLADMAALRRQSLEAPLDANGLKRAHHLAVTLQEATDADLVAKGMAADSLVHRITYEVRAAGSDTALPVTPGTLDAVTQAFRAQHRKTFGFAPSTDALVIATVQVEATAPSYHAVPGAPSRTPQAPATARAWFANGWSDVPLLDRDGLDEGVPVVGPALIAEPHGMVVVEPGWTVVRCQDGTLLLSHAQTRTRSHAALDLRTPDPAQLELFSSRFMAIAEQMGAMLAHTAHSVTIRERLDFSCALFDADGALIANAPHIPVHLGSMGDSVRAVMQQWDGYMTAGDAYALNDPFAGGTHLPDITVVSPVFTADQAERPAFYVASRGHHADVGGLTPGSMPAHSRTLADEGAVFRGERILHNGQLDRETVLHLLTHGPHPARNPVQNLADMQAQLAANAAGASALQALVAEAGIEAVQAYAGFVLDNGEAAVRALLDRIETGSARMTMDDGAIIAVRVAREAGGLLVDFTGTSPQAPGNTNAPLAITRAAVLYVLRCLVGQPIPLNDGCLRPVRMVVPAESLLNPSPPAAVVAGNVETSQQVVDALLAAVSAQAASQGTMNNLTLGDGAVQYYETLCGGTGAGPGFAGASGVHAHMTNSRLTDPEILEARLPIRLERFALRTGSGGTGQYAGGDGVVRHMVAEAPLSLSILSQRRTVVPPGLHGGGSGQNGRNRLVRAHGAEEMLKGVDTASLNPGDAVVIETPGGGGYGSNSLPPKDA